MGKDKNSKRCSGKKKMLWYLFGIAGLGVRGLAAFSLLAIALMLCSVKKEAKLFNDCVEELNDSGKTTSESVRLCNGGS